MAPLRATRVVTVVYGKFRAALNLPTTGAMPKANEKTMEGRFAGVYNALMEALPKEPKKDEKKGTEK